MNDNMNRIGVVACSFDKVSSLLNKKTKRMTSSILGKGPYYMRSEAHAPNKGDGNSLLHILMSIAASTSISGSSMNVAFHKPMHMKPQSITPDGTFEDLIDDVKPENEFNDTINVYSEGTKPPAAYPIRHLFQLLEVIFISCGSLKHFTPLKFAIRLFQIANDRYPILDGAFANTE